MLFLTLQSTAADDPGPDDMHRVGTVGIIRQMARTNAGLQIIVEGLQRAHADVVNRTGETMSANISPQPEKATEQSKSTPTSGGSRNRSIGRYRSRAACRRSCAASSRTSTIRCGWLTCWRACSTCRPRRNRRFSRQSTLLAKLEAVSGALSREIALLEMKGKIESQAQQEMSDAQRQYYLRQQLKAIQEELGEGEADELKLLREKVAAAKLPETAASGADRELDRLARMNRRRPITR